MKTITQKKIELEERFFNNRRFSASECFRWFLDVLLNEFKQKPTPDMPDEIKPLMTEIILEYLALVGQEEPLTDLLGNIYMNLSSRGQKSQMGQFFTPEPIAMMMAAMTFGAELEPKADGDLYRTIDPACGSGVMMLTSARHILQFQGPDALRQWSFSGIDLDYICARMFAVQFLANAMVHDLTFGELWCAQGDALANDVSEMKVIVHATRPDLQNITPALHPARIEAVAAAAKTHAEQLAFSF